MIPRFVCAGLSAGLLSACVSSIEVSPDTFNLDPAALSHLPSAKGVALENAYKADAPQNIPMGESTWIVEQKRTTDAAIVMLRRALEKQGLGAASLSGKTVTLRVHSPRAHVRAMPFHASVHASLALEAEFGDGTKTTLYSDNQSPMGGPRAFEGAILFALNKLLVDEKFVAYMNR